MAPGADVVGMSTVGEVTLARHAGLDVLGFGLVVNLASGLHPGHIDHEKVCATHGHHYIDYPSTTRRCVARPCPVSPLCHLQQDTLAMAEVGGKKASALPCLSLHDA